MGKKQQQELEEEISSSEIKARERKIICKIIGYRLEESEDLERVLVMPIFSSEKGSYKGKTYTTMQEAVKAREKKEQERSKNMP